MRFHHRIRTIYVKELTDILRDRRTLLAMVVVPIALYPLLMLGSVQAVGHQAESLGQGPLAIGVVDAKDRAILDYLLKEDHQRQSQVATVGEPTSPSQEDQSPPSIDQWRIEVVGSVEALEQQIRARELPIGIVFELDRIVDDVERTNPLKVYVDPEEPRGFAAHRRLITVFDRLAEKISKFRLHQSGLPSTAITPFEIETVDLSDPSSILGAILPLVLVLMTITGAIYPAIDLTAGERERGTLESLMVCPVPVLDLIVGKFLVVTTVAVIGAALNLGSVTATVYFGGFGKYIASTGGKLPLGKMFFILVSLIPFAVFMSAVMIAVCSCARTFKEAQNYVTPVILAVLIPGGIAAFPATRLEGIMLVMPVGNMVLLAKELLLGASVAFGQIAVVLLSTTLYACAAVAVAATVFGRESVVFADTGSLRSAVSRRFILPTTTPSVATALACVALLFPIWFYVQAALSRDGGEDMRGLLHASGLLMPLLFVGVPLAVMGYWKIDVRATFRLRSPSLRDVVAAALIGLSAWVLAHQINVFQAAWLGIPRGVVDSAQQLAHTLQTMNPLMVLLLIALIPALCEELLFRGFLLSAVGAAGGARTGIFVSAVIFGVFHFAVFKLAVTVGLGLVLGFLCWRSGSIVPAMLVHVMHNGLGAATVLRPDWIECLGIAQSREAQLAYVHLPVPVIIVGVAMFSTGLYLVYRSNRSCSSRQPLRMITEVAR